MSEHNNDARAGSDSRDVTDRPDGTDHRSDVDSSDARATVGGETANDRDLAADRPSWQRDLTDEQVRLYDRMLNRVCADRVDYWTALRGLDAPAADKYALADALYAPAEAREYARQAGIDLVRTYQTDQGEHVTRDVAMGELRVGDRFVSELTHEGHRVFKVVAECADNERGWLFVRDLSMSDERAAELLATPGAVEPGCDPREGFFAHPLHTPMHRVIAAEEVTLRGRDPMPSPSDSALEYAGMSRQEYTRLRTEYLHRLDGRVVRGELTAADRDAIVGVRLGPVGLVCELEHLRASDGADLPEAPAVTGDQTVAGASTATATPHQQGIADGYGGGPYDPDLFTHPEHGRAYRAGLQQGRTAGVDEELTAACGQRPGPAGRRADDPGHHATGWDAPAGNSADADDTDDCL